MAVKHAKVDVVTIGAGWTAAMLAAKLCPHGTSMVSLEQGDARWTYPHFAHDHDSLRYSVRYAMMVDLQRESWTWRPNPNAPALPMRQYGSFNPGKGLGGAAVHWSAQLWRYQETDFRYRSHVIERYGAKRSTTGCTVQDWGITYDELEPYYDAFEYDIGASGQAGNINGKKIRGGNIFESPRTAAIRIRRYGDAARRELRHGLRKPRPAPVHAAGRDHLQRLDRPVRQPPRRLPLLRLLHTLRLRGRREGEPTQHPSSGCPEQRQLRSAHPREGACASRAARTGSRPESPTSTRTATSTSSPPRPWSSRPSRSRTTACCCSPAAKQHPAGIGNDRGRVGKNYTYQIYPAPVTGLWEGEKLNMYMGNTCTIKIIYDYNADNFDHSDLDFIGGSQLYSEPCEREPVNSVDGLKDKKGRAWGADWKNEIRKNWDSYAQIVTEGESLPYVDQFVDLDPNYTDKWGNPLLRISFDWHDNQRALWRFVAKKALAIMKR